MLSVRDATKTFSAGGQPVRALCGVDVDVATGRCTAILGPSGSGKTTLLRVLAGFERLDAGEVRLDERVLSGAAAHVAPQRRRIGLLAQQGALFPHLDVAANVGFGLGVGPTRWTRRARRARAARVAETLELVGLAGYERRRVYELSGGQQQRVALARALAPAPRVVLLDEPFSALDAALRAELREEVRELLRGIGATVVLVTHDQEEALSLADHVAVMRAGRVVQAARPETVYSMPGDLGTARFVGDAVVLPARLAEGADPSSGQVECALGTITVRDASPAVADPGHACLVMLRPEQLELTGDGTAARVVGGSFFGHDAIVRVRLGADGSGPLVPVRTMRQGLPAVDAVVRLGVRGVGTAYPVDPPAPSTRVAVPAPAAAAAAAAAATASVA